MKRYSAFIIIIISILTGYMQSWAQGSFPLQITPSMPPPYPNRLSDFTDFERDLFVNIFNSSDETYYIILTGKLENRLRDVRIFTDPVFPPTQEIEIVPGNNQLMVEDLEELFDSDHLVMEGASRSDIMSDEALPEGEYTFCLRAFDALMPGRALSPDPELSFSGCFTFPVTLVDPPRINEAFCDSYISTTIPTVPVNWNWVRPALGSENVEFTLRIVELDPPDRVVNDAWLSATAPELFYEDGIISTFRNVSIPDDVTLIPGFSYVVQVIAEDPTGEVRFKNGGRSEPCVFHYRDNVTSIGRPRWITNQDEIFESETDIYIEYEVPLPEYTSEQLDQDIYVFEIPEGMSEAEAFGLEDWAHHDNRAEIEFDGESGPIGYGGFEHTLEFGKKYGVVIRVSDSHTREGILLENGGESEILVFHYGRSQLIPKPEWITEQDENFESPEDVILGFKIQMEEGTVMQLDAEVKFFIIPNEMNIEVAAELERDLHVTHIASGDEFDDRPIELETVPSSDYLEPGKTYGAYIEISDPSRREDGTYSFENNGRSDILAFSIGATGGTDIVLTYPLDGDRIPFSFFPLIARYEPFNPQYQHWKHLCNLLKNGSPFDRYGGGPGLRWPGGSHAGQIAGGLSDEQSLTESESQNIAVYKSNADDPLMFERGADYRWEVNVKLYDDVAGVGTFIEFDKNATFSRGMEHSQLVQPEYGASIAEDSTFNFRWITADAPEKLLPDHRINHANRSSLRFFNGTVDEKWVLEVDTTESFSPSTVIFHQEGRIGYGLIDFASSDLDEGEIIAALYKELESAESFTPIDTGYYYWRVKWLSDPEGSWDSEHYESSQIRPFYVGDNPPGGPIADTEAPEGCVSECLSAEITNVVPLSELTEGSTVIVGQFRMNVTGVSSGSRGRFTGTGEITIPFLNDIRVLVEFENIRINNAMQMFGGKVTARNDVPSISMDSTAVTIRGQRVMIPSMSETESQILSATVTSSERLVSLMSGERPIGMPIGFDNEIDGTSYVIGITEMEFKSRKAELTAAMRFDIPSIGKYIPALGAKGICFTPGGLGDEGRLFLLRNWTVTPDESDVQFSFSGCESGDTTRATYVEWDCEGFKCIAIRGEVEFSTDMLFKEDAEGNVLEGENVVADFGVKACRGNNWIAEIGIDPFQLHGMYGWGFSASRAYLDFSDIENPAMLTFPDNYDMGVFGISERTEEEDASRLENTWKGFYLTGVIVHTPKDFESDVAGQVEFGIQNVIIDIGNGGGLTASIVARNILDINSGSVDNLSFSLDTVHISVVQSSIFEGGLEGKIGLPIFEVDDHLAYQALVAYQPEEGISFNFNVHVDDTLNVPMWDVAEMYFAPESTIGIERKAGGEGMKTYVFTDLSGGINLTGSIGTGSDGSGGIPGVNFRGIRYEHLVYNSDGSRLTIGDFSFTSEQKSTAGFPVNINDIGIDLSMPRVGITFDLELILAEAGFSAEAGFGVYGRLDLSGDREFFVFDGVNLNSIEIHQEISSVRLDGRLDFYNGHETYGDGVRGSLAVVMPMGLAASMTVQFGTKKREGAVNPRFNTADYFPYWYVDGLVVLPSPGIVIFSGFAIYGFGGGVYYRMRPDYSRVASTASMIASDGESGRQEAPASGVRYIPDWNTVFGFKIMAVMGTSPSEQAFNMDVSIEMNFTESGGLGLFSIDGAGYVMASFAERPSAKVWATVHFAYINPGDGSERFEGNFTIYLDVEGVLVGAGTSKEFVRAEFLVQDDYWYYYMGRQQMDQRGGLVISLGEILNIDLLTYLMMGHGIPRRLPPLPEFIANLVNGPGQGRLNRGAANASTVDAREFLPHEEAKMNNATGFAFGTYMSMNARFNFAIFYAELAAHFGFDLLINKDEDRICLESGLPPGVNDWYASGQIYLGMRGEFGVSVDLFFIKGEYPIVELAAAVAMQGGFPNPTWATGRAGLYYNILGGMVEGQCNFEVQIGQQCSVVEENPLSSMPFIADIMPEEGSEANVFVVPEVSFNMPVNKRLEFPAGLDNDPTAVRIFEPFIDYFRLIDVDGGNATVPGDFELNETNTIASFVFSDPEVLEGENRYRVEISVKAYEHSPDGSRRIVKEGTADWADRKTVSFRTGPRPDVLVEENVMFTYPIKNQAYYLQGQITAASSSSGRTRRQSGLVSIPGGSFTRATETEGNMIRVARTQHYLFESNIDGAEYTYVARVKPVSGGEPDEVPVTTAENGISFKLPNLENEEYYVVQIVRKPVMIITQQIDQRGLEPPSGLLIPISQSFSLSGNAGTARVNLQQQQLPGETVGKRETLLYHFYFRTSRYNTLREKIAGLRFTPERRTLGIVKLNGEIDEPFDGYDLRGYFKNGRQMLRPLVHVEDPFSFNYHNNTAYPKVYDLYYQVRDLKYSNRRLRGMSWYYRGNSDTGFPPKRAVYIAPSVDIESPVQEWELEREAGINSNTTSATSSSTGSTGSYVTSSVQIGAQLEGGVSGLFAGSTGNINLSNAYIGGGSSAEDFSLTYSSNVFIKIDAAAIKSRLAAIVSYRNSAGYVYRTILQRQHPVEYGNIMNTLRTNLNAFDFTPGSYGISISLMAPTLNSGESSFFPRQRQQSATLKRFNL